MESFKTEKGNELMPYKNYSYVILRKNNNTIRWKCSQNTTLKCPGKITTNLIKPYINYSNIVAHNHTSNNKIEEIIVIKHNIKKRALDTRETPSQMVSSIMHNISEDTAVTLGNMSSIKRNIRNYRHRKFPDEPLNANFCLPEEWKTTMGAEPKPFLIFDNKQADSRILIFASNFALNILSCAETWFMDGTFKCSTTIFQQLYVIRGKYKNQISTCVYAFLPNKLKSTYITILQQVVINCLQSSNNLKPKYIVMDFEIGAISATKHVFGDSVQVKGCFFHLCQSMWRKIQHLGLSSVYKNNKNIRINCSMINALAFLPLNEVSSGMAYLYTIIPIELLLVAKYFDDIYVSGTSGTPMFSPILWNVFDVTLNGGDRTNNYCEGWNNYFNKLVGTSNPSFWLVLQCIQQDESTMRIESIRHEQPNNFTSRKKNKKYASLQYKLHETITSYVNKEITMDIFLNIIGKLL